MYIKSIIVSFLLIAVFGLLTGINYTAVAGPPVPTPTPVIGCCFDSNVSAQGGCEITNAGECTGGFQTFYEGQICDGTSSDGVCREILPGNCTVTSTDISTNLICLCQNTTKKGKDTFQIIECGNDTQIEECERSQGEVRQYINADDSAELFTFDCSEVSCLDVCLND